MATARSVFALAAVLALCVLACDARRLFAKVPPGMSAQRAPPASGAPAAQGAPAAAAGAGADFGPCKDGSGKCIDTTKKGCSIQPARLLCPGGANILCCKGEVTDTPSSTAAPAAAPASAPAAAPAAAAPAPQTPTQAQTQTPASPQAAAAPAAAPAAGDGSDPLAGKQLSPAEAEFRKKIVAFIEKYNGATEGGADGKFKELFPTIAQTRAAVKGYTTCVDFVGKTFASTGVKVTPPPSVYFFDSQLRTKNKIPPTAFFQLVTPTAPKPDATAQFVDFAANPLNSPLPLPGDVFLLQFSSGSMKGYFAHMSVMHKDAGREGNVVKWSVIQGGAGRAPQEKVAESELAVDMTTGKVVGAERFLRGWISVGELIPK